jgi:hypothetical protein
MFGSSEGASGSGFSVSGILAYVKQFFAHFFSSK